MCERGRQSDDGESKRERQIFMYRKKRERAAVGKLVWNWELGLVECFVIFSSEKVPGLLPPSLTHTQGERNSFRPSTTVRELSMKREWWVSFTYICIYVCICVCVGVPLYIFTCTVTSGGLTHWPWIWVLRAQRFLLIPTVEWGILSSFHWGKFPRAEYNQHFVHNMQSVSFWVALIPRECGLINTTDKFNYTTNQITYSLSK